jgi:hypothetical protein
VRSSGRLITRARVKRGARALLAGAALTIGGAWAIDAFPRLFPTPRFAGPHLDSHDLIEWRTASGGHLVSLVDEGWGTGNVYTAWFTPDEFDAIRRMYPNRKRATCLPAWCREDWAVYAMARPDPAFEYYAESASGWPRLAVARRLTAPVNAPVIDSDAVTLPTPRAFASSHRTRVSLPIRVLIPGFLANTLFYALPTYAALTGIQALRRLRRRLSNRCPACGYSLDDLPSNTCPECGASSRRRPVQDRCGWWCNPGFGCL